MENFDIYVKQVSKEGLGLISTHIDESNWLKGTSKFAKLFDYAMHNQKVSKVVIFKVNSIKEGDIF